MSGTFPGYPAPYSAPSWPAHADEATKAECRAMAKGGCELNRSEEEFARAIAMIGRLPVRFTERAPCGGYRDVEAA